MFKEKMFKEKIEKYKDFFELLPLLRKYIFLILIAIPFSFVFSSSRGVLALVAKESIDRGLIGNDTRYLIYIAIFILIFFLATNISRLISAFLIHSAVHGMIKDIRMHIFDRLQSVPLNTQIGSASAVSRVISDTEVLTRLPDIIKTIIKEPVSLLFLSAVLIYMNAKLAIFSVIAFSLVIIPANYISKKVKKSSRKVREAADKISEKIIDSIQGARVVRVYSPYIFRGSFKRHLTDFRKNIVKANILTEATSSISEVAGAMIVSFVIVYSGYQIAGGSMSVGEFFAFFGATVGLWEPIKRITFSIPELASITPSISRIIEFQKTPELKAGRVPKNRFDSSIDFVNLSVKFGDKIILKDVNISINKGDRIAIIGSSGVGKTTFVSLIPRFLDPTDGEIFIDGVNIKDIDLHHLRSLISFVEQEPFIFDASVYENIAFAKPETDYEEVERAMRKAGLDPNDFPDGLNFRCGDRGKNLSVGQKHRVAIARAFLKDSPIIIMDEPTASIDPKVEEELVNSFEGLMKGRTVIIISHKLKTVKWASRYIMIEDGTVREVDQERIINFFLSL